MRPPDKERPAPALAGKPASVNCALGSGQTSSSDDASIAQLKKRELLDRLDVLEVLSHWKLELQAELARKQVTFLYADSNVEFGELAGEVKDFVRVSKLLRWARRYQL